MIILSGSYGKSMYGGWYCMLCVTDEKYTIIERINEHFNTLKEYKKFLENYTSGKIVLCDETIRFDN